MSKKKDESKIEREKRIKYEKPYLSCTWYPMECDGGCDTESEAGLRGPCRDYREEETW